VLAAAAPLLVPIVEEGRRQDDPVVLAVLSDYLRELQRARPAVLILGCTHYPLLARAIAKVMGPDTHLLDPGESAAEAVAARLGESRLQSRTGAGTLRCFSTGSPDRFARLARRFLGRDVGEVTRVGTDELVLHTRGAVEP
jgi:glutamate racemase